MSYQFVKINNANNIMQLPLFLSLSFLPNHNIYPKLHQHCQELNKKVYQMTVNFYFLSRIELDIAVWLLRFDYLYI